MFVAVYEFEIKEGAETSFREAWLAVTITCSLFWLSQSRFPIADAARGESVRY